MKANVTIKVDSGKTEYCMLFPAVAYENNKAYHSYTIGVQFLKRYVEMIFTFGD